MCEQVYLEIPNHLGAFIFVRVFVELEAGTAIGGR